MTTMTKQSKRVKSKKTELDQILELIEREPMVTRWELIQHFRENDMNPAWINWLKDIVL